MGISCIDGFVGVVSKNKENLTLTIYQLISPVWYNRSNYLNIIHLRRDLARI